VHGDEKSSDYLQFQFKGDTLIMHDKTSSNAYELTEWKRVGSEEVKDKYLERELIPMQELKQRYEARQSK